MSTFRKLWEQAKPKLCSWPIVTPQEIKITGTPSPDITINWDTLRSMGGLTAEEAWDNLTRKLDDEEPKLYDDQLRHFFDNLWRWKFGLPEKSEDGYHPYGKAKDLDNIPKCQYSGEFTKLMNNRMIMGYFRYGDKSNPSQRKTFDYIKSIERRLAIYKEEGNTEQLIDIANMCRMEFEHPQHSKAHFKSTDDINHTHPSDIK